MKLNEVLTKKILFVLLFALLTFVGYQINFSEIIGAANQSFTFFQFFGPMAGAFLGPVVGIIAVFIAEVGNYLLLGKAFDAIGILRLLPMLFAAIYFASNRKTISKASSFIPLVCMGLFWLHPVGQQAWIYPLYWVIPFAGKFLTKNLFVRSLGSTFTAHAVGSTLWLYTVPMSAEAWLGLIPLVAMERILFACGISLSFIVLNTLLSEFESIIPANVLRVHGEYVLSRKKVPALA